MTSKKAVHKTYTKPGLVKHENLKEITFECPEWQCSVTVPGPWTGPTT